MIPTRARDSHKVRHWSPLIPSGRIASGLGGLGEMPRGQHLQERERGATTVFRGQAAGAAAGNAAKHGSSSGEKEMSTASDEAKEDSGGGTGWFGWVGVAALVVVAAALASDMLHLPPNLCRSLTLHARPLPTKLGTSPPPFSLPAESCAHTPISHRRPRSHPIPKHRHKPSIRMTYMRPIFTPVPVPHDEWRAPRSYSLMLYREQGVHAPGTRSVRRPPPRLPSVRLLPSLGRFGTGTMRVNPPVTRSSL